MNFSADPRVYEQRREITKNVWILLKEYEKENNMSKKIEKNNNNNNNNNNNSNNYNNSNVSAKTKENIHKKGKKKTN